MWRTNAECAAKSWVIFISTSFGIRVDILDRLNSTDSDVDPFFFSEMPKPFKVVDDVVRCLMGGRLITGTSGISIICRDGGIALRILIFRKAFFHSCLPTVLSASGVGAQSSEKSSATGEFKGVGGTSGDVGVGGSLIIMVVSDVWRFVGSYIWDLFVGSPWASKSSLSIAALRHVERENAPRMRHAPLNTEFKWHPAIKKPPFTQVIPGRCQKRSLASMRTSLNHFWPRWREKVHLSEANHAETAARPNEVNVVRTVVMVEAIKDCIRLVNGNAKMFQCHAYLMRCISETAKSNREASDR